MKALSNITPFSVERITTIENQPFPMHEFTSEVWTRIIKPLRTSKEGESAESIVEKTLNVVAIGMEGGGYEPTEVDRDQIKAMLPNGVIREYLHRLCMLNDYGFDTVKTSEKKYEAALSNATK